MEAFPSYSLAAPPRRPTWPADVAGASWQSRHQFHAAAFDTANLTPDQLVMPYQRWNCYKIGFYTHGSALVRCGGQTLTIESPSLIFYNPLQPYCCEEHHGLRGFFCQFTEDFLGGSGTNSGAALRESPLFRLGLPPLFRLPPARAALVRQVFGQMLAELASDYRHRDELLGTHVRLLVHLALQLREPGAPLPAPTPAGRLAAQFLELLEQQFPVASPAAPLPLHTAQHFARELGIHVNHLNRVLREVTGRTTSAHLAERIAREARALLRHTEWPIADIADGLAFAEVTYFNRFFRKQAGLSPKDFRRQPPTAA